MTNIRRALAPLWVMRAKPIENVYLLLGRKMDAK
jgi:hypothetical protein